MLRSFTCVLGSVCRSGPRSVAQRLSDLDHDEAAALLTVLAAASVAPSKVRFTETDGPCDRVRLGRVARWLGRGLDHGCVGAEAGRVVSLALTGTRLTTLDALSALPALRHVAMRRGALRAIGTLGNGCRELRSLDASHNRLSSVTPLAMLERLDRLALSDNDVSDVTALAGLGIRDLDLSRNPIPSLDAVPALPALARLRLTGTRIASVDLADLARLPADVWVDLRRTPLEEVVGEHTVDRALADPTLRTPGGATLSVAGTPLGDRLTADALAHHDGTARHVTEALPRFRGRWQGSRRRGRTQTGFVTRIDQQGEADWLRGVRTLAFDIDRAVSVTVTASVERGRLRIYLQSGPGDEAFVWADAVPGRPLHVTGPLISMGRRPFVAVEAMGGRAEGIRWSVRGAS